MDHLDALVAISTGQATTEGAMERQRRLLASLRQVIPYDAAALLRLDKDRLIPLVASGLSAAASAKPYPLRDHPRLEIICRATEPVFFPSDTLLPDPFDGELEGDEGALHRVHACLGCPLVVHGEWVGALTADALDPHAFENIDRRFLTAVSALAAAELRTTALIATLEHAAHRQGLIARDLMREAMIQGSEILGTSPVIARLRKDIELVARSDLTVLITGETGSGKELVARAVHAASTRRNEPIIYVNCAALPETLAESELFGHVRGAFTGATTDRPGKFEVADGGTLFLDEIGELPQAVQAKLLRVLQEGEIQRVGADRPLTVNVRLVAATNRDLSGEVTAGRFRADLYHRLHVYPLPVPPLRERGEDIALLASYFCDLNRRRMGLGPIRLDKSAIDALSAYTWPGNVRELENVISRVVLRVGAQVPRGETIILTGRQLEKDLGLAPALPMAPIQVFVPGQKPSLRSTLRTHKREILAQALEANQYNISATARALGMDRGNLHRLVQRLGIKPPTG